MPEEEAKPKVDIDKSVCLNVIIRRHGEKGPDESLSENDSQPEEFGKEISAESKIYTSFAHRAVQTAEKIAQGADTPNQTRERFELITSKLLPENFQAGLKNDYETGFRAIMADNRACALAASGIAALIEKFRLMSAKLKDGTNLTVPCITHDLEIACFLKQALIRKVEEGERIFGFNNIKDIDGPFAPNEYFQLTLKRIGGKEEISLKFSNPQRLSGVACEIDIEKVTKLAFLYQEKTKEKN